MGAGKRKKLEAAVAAIRRRWGHKALSRGATRPQSSGYPHIPTGFAALDQALDGIGGIPRGRLSELLGRPTSGMVTLALKLIERAQAGGDNAAYLDLGGAFDPDYARRCGIDLGRLLLVRPRSGAEGLAISYSLLSGRGVGILVFDNVSHLLGSPEQTQQLTALLGQLVSPLAQSPCAAVFLTYLQTGGAMSTANYPSGFPLPYYASLRLELRKERWIVRQRDVRGYEAQVLVRKNKLGRAGQRARIAITFNGVVSGDGT